MPKVAHSFFSLLLVAIAALQLNDPDPLFWCSLYLAAAVVPLSQLLNWPARGRSFLYGIAVGFCLAGLALALHGLFDYLPHISDESLIQDMSPERPYIEETREFLGTLIALCIVSVYCWINVK